MASNTITTSLVLKTGAFNRKLTAVQNKLNVLSGTGKLVGRTMGYAVVGGLLAAGAASVKAAVDFDLTIAKLKALAGPENANGVDRLAKTARKLGENSIYTASQVAEMQLSLKKLGLEVGTIDEMSESVLSFATAMDVDVNTAGETVINTMKKFTNSFAEFGTEQEKAAAISEQFAAATVNSALRFDTLRSSLNYAGAEANAAGFTFDQTAAILGKLADAGFNSSRGGVILRKVLQSVGKQGGDTVKNFEGLIKNQKEFNEVMKIVGVRAAGGTLALGGLGDEIDELAEKIRTSEGQVDAFSDAVEGSFMGRLKNVVSAIEEVGIALLTQFEEPIKRAISNFARLIRTIRSEDIKRFGETLMFLGKAFIASQVISLSVGLYKNLNVLFGAVMKIAKSGFGRAIAAELGLLRGGIMLLGGPVLLAVGAMTLGLQNLYDKFQQARAEIANYEAQVAGAAKTQKNVNEAFAELKDMDAGEVYKRIKDGAIETMLAWEKGDFAADGKTVSELFIPQETYRDLVERAKIAAAFTGRTFAEELKRAIKKDYGTSIAEDIAAKTEEAGKSIRESFDGRYGGDPELTKEMIKADKAAYDFNERAKLLGTTISDLRDENWDIPEEGLLNLALFGEDEEGEIDTKELERLKGEYNMVRQLGMELQDTFIGVGNILGNAFQQAATGARAFGDALKQNLLSAVSAVISKLIALSAAYGLAALAKAFLDGGTSIARGASAITSSGFGSFLAGGMGFNSQSNNNFEQLRTTGYVAGSDLVLTTGRGISANDRLYG